MNWIVGSSAVKKPHYDIALIIMLRSIMGRSVKSVMHSLVSVLIPLIEL